PFWYGVFCSVLVFLPCLFSVAACPSASRTFQEPTTAQPGSHSISATGLSSGLETVAASSHRPARATVPVTCSRPGVAYRLLTIRVVAAQPPAQTALAAVMSGSAGGSAQHL